MSRRSEEDLYGTGQVGDPGTSTVEERDLTGEIVEVHNVRTVGRFPRRDVTLTDERPDTEESGTRGSPVPFVYKTQE